MTERLKGRYKETIVPQLMKDLKYKNPYQVPRLSKIAINRGVGQAAQNSKLLESSLTELLNIGGQKAIVTRSKAAISGFKLRVQSPIGVAVILRSDRMYAFFDRLINLALPRIRDFHGLNFRSFDGKGNFSLGLEEQLMFPEIDYDQIDRIQGMDITIVTTAKTDDEGFALLKAFGMPFQD